MKQIPFYENRGDGLSCMLACLRSELEYLTGRSYSWDELELLTGYRGKPVWTARTWAALAGEGFDIQMIEVFDYRRFANDGVKYLEEYLKPAELEWQLANTDIMKLHSELPQFLNTVNHIRKAPTLKDVDALLDEGRLATITLNSHKLNGRQGFVSHMILVHDKLGSDFVAHDPGLPGIANRVIKAEVLFEAMGGKANTSEVTGVKKK